jgi:hypothetical protein
VLQYLGVSRILTTPVVIIRGCDLTRLRLFGGSDVHTISCSIEINVAVVELSGRWDTLNGVALGERALLSVVGRPRVPVAEDGCKHQANNDLSQKKCDKISRAKRHVSGLLFHERNNLPFWAEIQQFDEGSTIDALRMTHSYAEWWPTMTCKSATITRRRHHRFKCASKCRKVEKQARRNAVVHVRWGGGLLGGWPMAVGGDGTGTGSSVL